MSDKSRKAKATGTHPVGQEHLDVASFSFACPSGYKIPEHSHDWHQLIFAVTGVMTVKTAEGCWVVPSHRAVWVPAGMIHSIEMSGNVSMRTLYLKPELSESLPAKCCVINVAPLLRELILHICGLGGLSDNSPSHARLTGVVIDQLDAMSAAPLQLPMPTDPRALRIAQALMTNPGDAAPLSALAQQAGASKRTAERLFATQTGLTFARWRQQLRFLHALRLLAKGDSVTSVALDAGYESPSAFTFAFKKVMGMTPRAYYSGESDGKATVSTSAATRVRAGKTRIDSPTHRD